jgi:hypothetical protein
VIGHHETHNQLAANCRADFFVTAASIHREGPNWHRPDHR